MPWNTTEVVAARARFVEAVLAKNESVSALCRRFEIARTTGYLWVGRFQTGGRAALADRPKGARRGGCGSRRRHWEEVVLRWRRAHPTWGGRKLFASLQRHHRGARLPRAWCHDLGNTFSLEHA